MHYFDKIAPYYDDWFNTRIGKYVDKTEKHLVFQNLKTLKGLALDLGCGTGIYTLELEKRGLKVFGLDLSKNMLQLAKKKVKSSLLLRGNAYSLPFKNETFDLVLSITLFEFIDQPMKVLKEVYRVLKPEGEVLIGTMNGKSLWFLFKRLKSRFVETAYRYARFYTTSELENLFKNAGFKEIQTRGIIFFPSFFPFTNLAYHLDRSFSRVLKKFGAFVVVKGKKPG